MKILAAVDLTSVKCFIAKENDCLKDSQDGVSLISLQDSKMCNPIYNSVRVLRLFKEQPFKLYFDQPSQLLTVERSPYIREEEDLAGNFASNWA